MIFSMTVFALFVFAVLAVLVVLDVLAEKRGFYANKPGRDGLFYLPDFTSAEEGA